MEHPENKKLTSPWLFLAAFIIFAAALFPRMIQSPFYHGEYLSLNESSRFAEGPGALFVLDHDHRRHPLYYPVLFMESRILGASAPPYRAVIFLTHFMNVLLITALGLRLRFTKEASILAGLFFLFSSFHFQAVLIPSGRPLMASLLLSALILWCSFVERGGRGRLLLTLIFACAAVAVGEEGILFSPLAAIFVFLVSPLEPRPQWKIWVSLAVVTLAAVILLFYCQLDFVHFKGRGQWFTPQFLNPLFVLRKVLSLGKMLVLAPLIPAKNMFSFIPASMTWIRFFPVLLIAALLLVFLKKQGRLGHLCSHLVKRHAFFALAWVLITASPYFPNELPFEHASRYVYLPAVGFSLWVGNFLAGLVCPLMRPSKKESLFLAALFLYGMALNLSLTDYHHRRYQEVVQIDPEADYTEAVKRILSDSRRGIVIKI